MVEPATLRAAAELARTVHAGDASGHDWWHVARVAGLARRIAQAEGADADLCALAAWLHDIPDEKLSNDGGAAGMARVEEFLRMQPLNADASAHVLEIIQTLSFKGGGGRPMRTPEGACVRDADRLEALGAIGIARCFAYSGSVGQAIFDPAIAPRTTMTREQYRSEKSTAINHFHEKLLKLRELMQTVSGRALADERHAFLETFLRQFEAEWSAAADGDEAR